MLKDKKTNLLYFFKKKTFKKYNLQYQFENDRVRLSRWNRSQSMTDCPFLFTIDGTIFSIFDFVKVPK